MTPIHPHIEAIARAMCEHLGANADGRFTRLKIDGAPYLSDPVWMAHVPLATIAYRSTLSQIREPSRVVLSEAPDFIESKSGEIDDWHLLSIWRSMIDAHLSEIDAALK